MGRRPKHRPAFPGAENWSLELATALRSVEGSLVPTVLGACVELTSPCLDNADASTGPPSTTTIPFPRPIH